MSVKTLDDADREIEVSDELESLLHVLVYESCKYLPSNCEHVAQLMSYYFDGGLRQGLRFFSGQMKRSSMMMGAIKQLNGKPLIFRRPGARRPLPSRASDPHASASSPGAMATNDGAIPDDPRHPIQTIIDELLPLFKAHYFDHQRSQNVSSPDPDHDSNNARDGTKPEFELNAVNALAFSHFRKKRVTRPRRLLPDPEIEELAKALKTHDEFGAILVNAYECAAWPENDKLPDEALKDYDRKKRSTAKVTKGSLPKGAPPVKKRKSTLSKDAA